MPYEILLSKTALKTYEKLTDKLHEGIDRCIAYLEISPKYGTNIKKLRGKTDCYRYQVGGWRIVYEVNDAEKEVMIYDIGARGDVYKKH